MKKVFIKTEFIKLGQFLKYVNLISTGGDVKHFLDENKILVNGENENRRGKKLYVNDEIIVNNSTFIIADSDKG